jgi:hypothetical protein
MALLLLLVIAGAGYLVSLRIHPLRKCPVCKMTGRHYGSVYTESFRRCRKCNGSGRRDRLGTQLFFGGTNHTGLFTKK